MKEYGIKVRFRKEKGLAIHFDFGFPGSKIGNFHYTIVLPRNSFQLKLGLIMKGRKYKTPPWKRRPKIS